MGFNTRGRVNDITVFPLADEMSTTPLAPPPPVLDAHAKYLGEKKAQEDEIYRLLKEHENNKDLFYPLSDSMWLFYFDPVKCLTDKVDYLEPYFDNPVERGCWKEIGWWCGTT